MVAAGLLQLSDGQNVALLEGGVKSGSLADKDLLVLIEVVGSLLSMLPFSLPSERQGKAFECLSLCMCPGGTRLFADEQQHAEVETSEAVQTALRGLHRLHLWSISRPKRIKP